MEWWMDAREYSISAYENRRLFARTIPNRTRFVSFVQESHQETRQRIPPSSLNKANDPPFPLDKELPLETERPNFFPGKQGEVARNS